MLSDGKSCDYRKHDAFRMVRDANTENAVIIFDGRACAVKVSEISTVNSSWHFQAVRAYSSR